MNVPKGTLRRAACVVVLLCGCTGAHAQSGGVNAFSCGKIQSGYGPFDYRTLDPETRHRVEDYHFTAEVEGLKKGNTSAWAGDDIDYTLRAFPNSPRALLAVGKYALRFKNERPPGLKFTTECYYERAIRFQPTDPMVRVVYASYLRDRRRMPEVRKQLDEASQLRGDPTDFDLDYNLGLLYFELGDYDKSLEAAKRAYALGAPLPALMKKLKVAGKWKD